MAAVVGGGAIDYIYLVWRADVSIYSVLLEYPSHKNNRNGGNSAMPVVEHKTCTCSVLVLSCIYTYFW